MGSPPSSSISASAPSSAEAIRAHFSSILIDSYGVPPEEAEKAVAAWKYGKKAEVLSFDCETYRAIFGDEIGAILFGWKKDYGKKVVKKEFQEKSEWENSRTGACMAVKMMDDKKKERLEEAEEREKKMQ